MPLDREAARRQPRRVDEVLGREHPQPQHSNERASGDAARRGSALDKLTRRFAGNARRRRALARDRERASSSRSSARSGSGKTTTLRIVAGYETPDSGRVCARRAKDITHEPPQRRGFGMVFQHYALFPHMTVEENVAFGLEARGVAKAERLARARRGARRRRARGRRRRARSSRSRVASSSASRSRARS